MDNIFEDNSKNTVIRGVDGADMLLEGVDYSMTVTKQHETGVPTTFTVSTGYNDEVARLLALSGLEDGAVEASAEVPVEVAVDVEPEMTPEPTPEAETQRKVGGNPMSTDLPMPTDFAEAKRLAGIKVNESEVEVCESCGEADCVCETEVKESKHEADQIALMQELLAMGEDILEEGVADKIRARVQRRKAREAHADPANRIATRVDARPGALDKVAEKSRCRTKDADDVNLMSADIDPTDNVEPEAVAQSDQSFASQVASDAGYDSAPEAEVVAPEVVAPEAEVAVAPEAPQESEFARFCRENGLNKESSISDLQAAMAGTAFAAGTNLFALIKELPDAQLMDNDQAVIDGSEEDMFNGHQIGQETGYTPAMHESADEEDTDEEDETDEEEQNYFESVDARMNAIFGIKTL